MSKVRVKGLKINGRVNMTASSGGVNPPPFVPYMPLQYGSSEGSAGGLYGWDISINGNTMIVGAYGANSSSGAAYIYQSDGVAWSLLAELDGGEDYPNGRFGYSVDVTTNWAVISAPAFESGVVHVFHRSDNGWETEPYQTIRPSITGTFFGSSVAIDGNTLAIGHYNANSSIGVVEIWTHTSNGWSKQHTFSPQGTEPGIRTSKPYFGYSVALKDGIVVSGGPGNISGTGVGTVLYSKRTGATWTDPIFINPSETPSADGFGASVSINGGLIAVGSISTSGYGGKVFLFKNDGTFEAELSVGASSGTIIDPAVSSTSRVGYSVAIHNEGNIVAAGALNYRSQGAVFLFSKHDDGTWGPSVIDESTISVLQADPPLSNGRFGCSVEFMGYDLIVGAYGTAAIPGKVYWFKQPQ